MLTYTDQQNLCKEISNLSDTTAVTYFKRDLQAGTSRFLAKLSRPVDRQSRFTSSIANQQYYQLPEDAERVSDVIMLNGSNVWVPLKEVGDETTWRLLNQYPQTSNIASHFFVRGGDEFGIYPIPGSGVSNSIELVYEPKHVLLTADDYTAGTVSLTNGSATVTGSGTVFTPAMANGSYVIQITDGSDGNYYRISGYSSGTVLTLENFYQGITGTSATYRIGQVSKIPEEYQEAPVDYAMYRHFLGKNEMQNSALFQKNWQASLEDAENTYGMSTGSQIVTAGGNIHTFNPLLDVTQNQIRT